MATLIINTGTTANARNGDSLRTAFNKVNVNFAYLSSSSRSGSQGLIGFTGSRGFSGSAGLTPTTVPSSSTSPGIIGNIAYDSQYVYICVAANYWLRMYASTF